MALVPKALPASGTLLLFTGAVNVGGISYNNGSGGAGVITIYDSLTATGKIIYQESVATVTAVTRVINPPVTSTIGVTVNLSAGTATGAVWLD
jgi:hypothetical protein